MSGVVAYKHEVQHLIVGELINDSLALAISVLYMSWATGSTDHNSINYSHTSILIHATKTCKSFILVPHISYIESTSYIHKHKTYQLHFTEAMLVQHSMTARSAVQCSRLSATAHT